MQDTKSIANEVAKDIVHSLRFATNGKQNEGRVMYKNYCNACYKVFNFFDLIEKHHLVLRKNKDLINCYNIVHGILKDFVKKFEEGKSCKCDTDYQEIVWTTDNQVDEVQYDIWSHPLFLHYDYLVLDPMGLSNLQGPEDHNIEQLIRNRVTQIEDDDEEQEYQRWLEEHGDSYDSYDEDDDDSLIPIEEAGLQEPTFVIEEDLPQTPDQPVQVLQPQAPLQNRNTHNDAAENTDVRRRLYFGEDDVIPVMPRREGTYPRALLDIDEDDDEDDDIPSRPRIDDLERWALRRQQYGTANIDIQQWVLENVNEDTMDDPIEHPVLTMLIRRGHKELPEVTPGASIYSSEYRLNYRLSQKNFLIKEYVDEQESVSGEPLIRVYRDIPALVNEIKLWLGYFEKPHESIVSTTILSLQKKDMVNDCIYNIVKFI